MKHLRNNFASLATDIIIVYLQDHNMIKAGIRYTVSCVCQLMFPRQKVQYGIFIFLNHTLDLRLFVKQQHLIQYFISQ